ncbi:MAG: hypothetical protein M1828_002550 [Chrysothrix sp. TS-e1954]|nr:MAG: hypothetical protein M1828_002550 [Chrysothrix sp. TS-e1954]
MGSFKSLLCFKNFRGLHHTTNTVDPLPDGPLCHCQRPDSHRHPHPHPDTSDRPDTLPAQTFFDFSRLPNEVQNLVLLQYLKSSCSDITCSQHDPNLKIDNIDCIMTGSRCRESAKQESRLIDRMIRLMGVNTDFRKKTLHTAKVMFLYLSNHLSDTRRAWMSQLISLAALPRRNFGLFHGDDPWMIKTYYGPEGTKKWLLKAIRDWHRNDAVFVIKSSEDPTPRSRNLYLIRHDEADARDLREGFLKTAKRLWPNEVWSTKADVVPAPGTNYEEITRIRAQNGWKEYIPGPGYFP